MFVSGLSWLLLKLGVRVIRFATFLTYAYERRNAPGADQKAGGYRRVWIDVGAHRGETTFEPARQDPSLVVYAFEPDTTVAAHRYGLLDNFIVIPMAVSDQEGFREFYVNSNDRTSSLLALDPEAVSHWRGVHHLKTVRRVMVPTIRLDTFLCLTGIARVHYLKIDAQGHDLEVLKSLGDRIHDILELKVEACAVSRSMYEQAHNQAAEITAFLESRGFSLVESQPESLGQEKNLVFRRAIELEGFSSPVECREV